MRRRHGPPLATPPPRFTWSASIRSNGKQMRVNFNLTPSRTRLGIRHRPPTTTPWPGTVTPPGPSSCDNLPSRVCCFFLTSLLIIERRYCFSSGYIFMKGRARARPFATDYVRSRTRCASPKLLFRPGSCLFAFVFHGIHQGARLLPLATAAAKSEISIGAGLKRHLTGDNKAFKMAPLIMPGCQGAAGVTVNFKSTRSLTCAQSARTEREL